MKLHMYRCSGNNTIRLLLRVDSRPSDFLAAILPSCPDGWKFEKEFDFEPEKAPLAIDPHKALADLKQQGFHVAHIRRDAH